METKKQGSSFFKNFATRNANMTRAERKRNAMRGVLARRAKKVKVTLPKV